MKDNMKCPKCGKKYISKSEYADWGNGKPAALYIHDYTKGKGIAITDYDEVTPRFDTAVVPLEQVMQGNVDFEVLNSLFKGVDLRQQQWQGR